MANLPPFPAVDFTADPERIAVKATFPLRVVNPTPNDPNSIQIQIRVEGDAREVNQFIEERAFSLELAKLSPDEADTHRATYLDTRRITLQEQWDALERYPQEPLTKPAQDPTQQTEPPSTALPALAVSIALDTYVLTPPYHIALIIDPTIAAGAPGKSYTVFINNPALSGLEEATVLNLTCHASIGIARVTPGGFGSRRTPNAIWNDTVRGGKISVFVERDNNDPVTFTLTGDIYVL